MEKVAQKSSRTPAYIAYTVTEGKPSADGEVTKYWTRIGVVFNHPKSEGFRIKLNALPLDGTIVCVPPPKEQNGTAS